MCIYIDFMLFSSLLFSDENGDFKNAIENNIFHSFFILYSYFIRQSQEKSKSFSQHLDTINYF